MPAPTPQPTAQPYRSVLYVPADNARAVQKARALNADAVVLDLEDAVHPDAKAAARTAATQALRGGFGCPVMLRLNGLDSPHFQADLEAALLSAPAGIVLPKAEDARAVRELHLGVPLWLMIETPLGVLRAPELAAVPGVAGLMVGANDLHLALHARRTPDRAALAYTLGAVLLAARAAGVTALDAVYNDLHDLQGLERECVQARDLGYDGKTLIHPAQVDVANRAFGVTEEEAQAARDLLATWDAAGAGVVTHQGRMIEDLHARQARDTLARHAREQRTA
ncbi:HpcH/HpaI aldolase/citrate lyase family protein [Deinococcus aquiradiocola]|uniref:CoA ester lyase n=1 Tax=Deinococcus aquiradiocola TaxID=393059 RepID=A0A917URV1_9DEIO|nr:CoA ester lyase [Deinococcus aquiradiocola]GGJ80765.1 CoA ester lyase [Deinococcus aquiradiocola]